MRLSCTSQIFLYEKKIGLQLYIYKTNHILSTGCRSLVVVLSLSKREVVSSSPTQAGRFEPKTFKIGSDCSFAKSTAFRR
jgi:hypothetical protein